MKFFVEMLEDSWKLTVSRWSFRMLLPMLLVGMVSNELISFLESYFHAHGIQSASMYIRDWYAENKSIMIPMPLSSQLSPMVWATVFQSFITLVFQGIAFFGVTTIALRAIRKQQDGWFGAGLGGFRIPLEVFWMRLLSMLLVFLWSLFLIVPGIIAIFRYGVAWNLKVDNPDWSAAKCLAESSAMTHGYRQYLFLFDLAVFSCILLVAGPVLVIGLVMLQFLPAIGLLMVLAGMVLMLIGVLFKEFGQSVYYIKLKRISEIKTDNSATDAE